MRVWQHPLFREGSTDGVLLAVYWRGRCAGNGHLAEDVEEQAAKDVDAARRAHALEEPVEDLANLLCPVLPPQSKHHQPLDQCVRHNAPHHVGDLAVVVILVKHVDVATHQEKERAQRELADIGRGIEAQPQRLHHERTQLVTAAVHLHLRLDELHKLDHDRKRVRHALLGGRCGGGGRHPLVARQRKKKYFFFLKERTNTPLNGPAAHQVGEVAERSKASV